MPSQVEQLQTLESGNLDRELGQAAHAKTWADTFSNTPPTEQLRANRNYVDLMNQAVERRQALEAQTDLHAEQLYERTQKFQQWKQDQPLRDDLLKARINASGATERFHQAQDAETMNSIAGFADHMLNAPQIGTSQYREHVLNGIEKFPRVISTAWGKDVLKNLSTEQDATAEIKKNIQMVRGTAEHKLASKYGLSAEQFLNPVSVKAGKMEGDKFTNNYDGADKGDMMLIETDQGSVPMPKAAFEAFKRGLIPQDQQIAPTATQEAPKAKHLGRFNPKTGEFE